MNSMAQNISEADLTDIAAYFASNERMKGEPTAEDPLGKNLFRRGDMKRDILPCISCHGDAGQGTFSGDESYPAIGGQHKLYLREQLHRWRNGQRGNGAGSAMSIITKSLSDAEMEALSTYIGSL
jgi:cytochrome c553